MLPEPRISRSPDYVSIVWADGYGRWYARVTDGPTAKRRAVYAIRKALQERGVIGAGYRVRVEPTEDKQLRFCQVLGQVIYRETGN